MTIVEMKSLDQSSGIAVMERLLNPVSLGDFLDRYWQKEVLVVNREEPHYYDDILTVQDIDALLDTTAIPLTQVNLGRDAVGVSSAAYGNGSYIQPAEVLRLHKEGKTISMRAM